MFSPIETAIIASAAVIFLLAVLGSCGVLGYHIGYRRQQKKWDKWWNEERQAEYK